MSTTFRRIGILGLLVPSLTGAAFANQEFGVLQGHVRDHAGRDLPSVVVVVTSPSLERPERTRSERDGSFRLTLPAGRYDVELTHPSYEQPVQYKQVAIKSSSTTTLPGSRFSAATLEGHDVPPGAHSVFRNPDGRPGTVGIMPQVGYFSNFNRQIRVNGEWQGSPGLGTDQYVAALSMIVPSNERVTWLVDLVYAFEELGQNTRQHGFGFTLGSRFWLGDPKD